MEAFFLDFARISKTTACSVAPSGSWVKKCTRHPQIDFTPALIVYAAELVGDINNHLQARPQVQAIIYALQGVHLSFFRWPILIRFQGTVRPAYRFTCHQMPSTKISDSSL